MIRVPRLAPLVLLMILAPLAFAAAPTASGLTTHILTATPGRTVVAVEFDAATTMERFTTPQDDMQLTDGYGTLLAIAGRGTPTATVLGYTLGEALPMAPALDALDIPVTSAELVAVGEPAIWHDLRIVSVGYRPVMQDADGIVRAVTSLEAEIVTSGAGVNEQNDPTSFSYAFYPAYRQVIANLDDVYPGLEVRAPGRMLIIVATGTFSEIGTSDNWLNWIDLKTRKGYQVQVATLQMIRNAVGDSTKVGIRNYVQQAYNSTTDRSLEYLILVDDVNRIPVHLMGNPEAPAEEKPGDNYYVAVAGDDYLPDIIAGRLCGFTDSETAAYLTKVVRYETDPFMANTAWQHAGSFIAGNYSDTGGNTVTPHWNMAWARQQFLNSGCITDADTFYYHGWPQEYPGEWTDEIIADINTGASIVLYRGWAAQTGWWYPLVLNSNLNQVVCGRKHPAVFSIVCGTGDYYMNGSSQKGFGEYFLHGVQSPSQNGAIVFYGASDVHTNTRHNNAILAGMTESMLNGGVRTTGILAAAGEMEAYRHFPLERTNAWVHYYVFQVFNILGDPETQLWVCPEALSVERPQSLAAGEGTVGIGVTSNGSPVADAVVTMRAGQGGAVYSTLTDASGQAWLDVDLAGSTVAQLTVWKDKYFQQHIDIPVTSSEYDPSVISLNWADGNDNLPNPGETVPFTLTVRNAGTAATGALTATVTSLDSRISVVNGSGTIGSLNPGESGATTAMSIHLGDTLQDGELPRLNVVLAGNGSVTRAVQVPVTAPRAHLLSLTVNDGGNGILEPGETASVVVTIRNTGHQNASNLTAVVYSWDNAVSFPDPNFGWGAVNIGAQSAASDPFQVTLANGVAPGRQVQLRYDIYNNGTLLYTTTQWLMTGNVTVNAPTGPDAYGYYAYENIDAGYSATPTYNWIELDPAHGGSGGQAHEVHDDTYFQFPLQQPFYYYGQPYNNIWICSNGWFSFEEPLFPEFQNWELPFQMPPWLMVCPYWDDLIGDPTPPNDTSYAWNVWTRFDTNPDRLTIMWRGFHRVDFSQAPETFEAVLEFNGQSDGSILFQYNQVSPRLGSNSNPSNYATVGFQNFYLRTGLTLSFANMYPASVDTVNPGRAIRITTQPPDNFLSTEEPAVPGLPTEYAFHEAYPNPFNPATELRYDLPEAARVKLVVYDVLGRERAVLVDEFHGAGTHRASFDGRSLPSGLYFARLSAGNFSQVRKLMLVK